jgi:hypothetical protein
MDLQYASSSCLFSSVCYILTKPRYSMTHVLDLREVYSKLVCVCVCVCLCVCVYVCVCTICVCVYVFVRNIPLFS